MHKVLDNALSRHATYINILTSTTQIMCIGYKFSQKLQCTLRISRSHPHCLAAGSQQGCNLALSNDLPLTNNGNTLADLLNLMQKMATQHNCGTLCSQIA